MQTGKILQKLGVWGLCTKCSFSSCYSVPSLSCIDFLANIRDLDYFYMLGDITEEGRDQLLTSLSRRTAGLKSASQKSNNFGKFEEPRWLFSPRADPICNHGEYDESLCS